MTRCYGYSLVALLVFSSTAHLHAAERKIRSERTISVKAFDTNQDGKITPKEFAEFAKKSKVAAKIRRAKYAAPQPEYPSLPEQVVDVQMGAFTAIVTSDIEPDPWEDCIPFVAWDYEQTMWANVYADGSTIPSPTSDPEAEGAQQLVYDGTRWTGEFEIEGGLVIPLPGYTLVIWERIEYLDVFGGVIEECTYLAQTTLHFYGHTVQEP